jgi:non-ribosomal peptide synthetase component E (peptide arylation enzyme)
MSVPQPAPILTLLKPLTVAAHTGTGFWGDETIYHLAARHTRTTPEAFAVRDRDRRLSYAELVAAADRAAYVRAHFEPEP